MLILTNATMWNPGVLETRSLPKKFLGRVLVLPLNPGFRTWARLTVELQPLRFLVTLLPFAVAPMMSRDLAVPVMQAPALMLILVFLVEMKLAAPCRRTIGTGACPAVDPCHGPKRHARSACPAAGPGGS